MHRTSSRVGKELNLIIFKSSKGNARETENKNRKNDETTSVIFRHFWLWNFQKRELSTFMANRLVDPRLNYIFMVKQQTKNTFLIKWKKETKSMYSSAFRIFQLISEFIHWPIKCSLYFLSTVFPLLLSLYRAQVIVANIS